MYIVTKSRTEYALFSNDNELQGILEYKSTSFREAEIKIKDENETIFLSSKNILLDSVSSITNTIQIATTKIGLSNAVVIHLIKQNKQYFFKKTGLWRIRFIVTNQKKEEIFALIPLISWTKNTHDYTIQLNEEYIEEITPLLLLHILHCANCVLNLMNGVTSL